MKGVTKLSTTEDAEGTEDIRLFTLIPEAAISPSSVSELLKSDADCPQRPSLENSADVEREAA
jgi:hypothetical protein